MNGELEQHNQMIRQIVRQTELDRARVERICYAGEPWIEMERFSGLYWRSVQSTEQTGRDPAGAMDALHALLKLEEELNQRQAEISDSGEGGNFQKRIHQVAGIAQESPQTVCRVVEAMLDFFKQQLTREIRRRPDPK